MKITRKEESIPGVSVQTVTYGDTVIFDNHVWILSRVPTFNNGTKVTLVRLADGQNREIPLDTRVVPVRGEFIY